MLQGARRTRTSNTHALVCLSFRGGFSARTLLARTRRTDRLEGKDLSWRHLRQVGKPDRHPEARRASRSNTSESSAIRAAGYTALRTAPAVPAGAATRTADAVRTIRAATRHRQGSPEGIGADGNGAPPPPDPADNLGSQDPPAPLPGTETPVRFAVAPAAGSDPATPGTPALETGAGAPAAVNTVPVSGGHQVRDRAGQRRDHVRDRAGQRRDHVRDRAGQRRDHVRDRAGQRGHHVRDRAGQRRDHVRDRAGQRRDHVRDRAGRAARPRS